MNVLVRFAGHTVIVSGWLVDGFAFETTLSVSAPTGNANALRDCERAVIITRPLATLANSCFAYITRRLQFRV